MDTIDMVNSFYNKADFIPTRKALIIDNKSRIV